MKTIIRTLVCPAVLIALMPAAASAQNHSLRNEGKILLLDNDRIMEGDIVRRGDQYLIRRQIGELALPAARVKHVCASWQQIVAYMHSKANLLDPDERLRLARWCHLNGRHECAIKELQTALKLRPGYYPAQQLLRVVERSALIAKRPPAEAQSHTDMPPPPALDLSADSLGEFVSKVQPILMNTCARCHANKQGGGFQLRRVYGSGPGSRRTTQYNLDAVVKLIHLDRPVISPLLIKAVSAHGTAIQPPIKSRRSPPYLTLRRWVENTIVNNPHLKEERIHLTSASANGAGTFAAGNTPDYQRPRPAAAPPRLLPKFPANTPIVQPRPPVPANNIQPVAAAAVQPATNPFVNVTGANRPPRGAVEKPFVPVAQGKQIMQGKIRYIPGRPIVPVTANAAAPTQRSNTSSASMYESGDAHNPDDFNRLAHPGRK